MTTWFDRSWFVVCSPDDFFECRDKHQVDCVVGTARVLDFAFLAERN